MLALVCTCVLAGPTCIPACTAIDSGNRDWIASVHKKKGVRVGPKGKKVHQIILVYKIIMVYNLVALLRVVGLGFAVTTA